MCSVYSKADVHHSVLKSDGMSSSATSLPTFDFAAFTAALNARRREFGLDWGQLAADLWDQSAALNADLDEGHTMCGGALSRLPNRNDTSCQYAMFVLRWMDRAPEDFMVGPVVDLGDTRLPRAGHDFRLRWDLGELYAAVDEQRRKRGLTWTALADLLECTHSRLTNLRAARQADLALVMRLTQWLHRPAAAFIHPTRW